VHGGRDIKDERSISWTVVSGSSCSISAASSNCVQTGTAETLHLVEKQ